MQNQPDEMFILKRGQKILKSHYYIKKYFLFLFDNFNKKSA